MSIPHREKIELIEYRRPLKVNIVESELDESLHVFDKQYEIAELLAGIIVDCIKTDQKEYNVNITRFGLPFKNVTIYVEKTNIMATINANISNIYNNGDLTINVYTPRDTFAYYSEQRLFKNIKNTLAHELEHGYTTLSIYNNSNENDCIYVGDLYEDIKSMIQNKSISEYLYDFAFTLYMVYGIELNAFISQCYGEVYDYLQRVNELTIEKVRDALKVTRTYSMFKNNVRVLNNVLKLTNTGKEQLIHEFNDEIESDENKIKNIGQLNKLTKQTLRRNESAVKMCHGTAIKAYYNLIEK